MTGNYFLPVSFPTVNMSVQREGSDDGAALEGEKAGWDTTISAPAAELLGEEAQPIDPEVERRVLRKIDLFLMPAMVIGKSCLLLALKPVMLI